MRVDARVGVEGGVLRGAEVSLHAGGYLREGASCRLTLPLVARAVPSDQWQTLFCSSVVGLGSGMVTVA